MNGKALVKLQETVRGMNDGEWRGYLAAKVEDLGSEQSVMKKDIKDVKICVGKVNMAVAKIPPHCIQSDVIKEIVKKVNILNEDKAGRKAVVKALWGSGGSLSIVGLAYLVLKVLGML